LLIDNDQLWRKKQKAECEMIIVYPNVTVISYFHSKLNRQSVKNCNNKSLWRCSWCNHSSTKSGILKKAESVGLNKKEDDLIGKFTIYLNGNN
jgi:hypothetical protein